MPASTLLEEIGRKESDRNAIATAVGRNAAALSEVLGGLAAAEPSVKYGCAKVLAALSERDPRALYSRFDEFVALLASQNKILRWQAIRIIANLSRVDSEAKLERVLDAYFAPIRGPELITAANIVKGAATIASAKPHLTPRIVEELLQVENAEYRTRECRNVALGHVIEALDSIFEQIEDRGAVLRLVGRQQRNTRNATKRKAERFLRKRGR